MLASWLHQATINTKPPYTVTGIIIHKLAASLFKPRGSKRGKKVAAYSPKITVFVNVLYYVHYRTNAGRVTPLTWLDPIEAYWSNLAQWAALFKHASFLWKGWERRSTCLM